jgi:hypothetical protein
LVKLQRQVGNAAIARTLAQRQEVPDEMMAKHDPDLQREDEVPDEMMAKHDPSIQREAIPEVGMAGGQISGELSSRIEAQRGGGIALDAGTRESMEAAYGDSFDDVRIHTGSEADSLNRSVSAKAFTTGTDIFFSQNASPNDSSLLAHELAHVVQQRGSSSSGGPMTVGAADDGHEHAADAAASAVASGSGVQRMAAPETIAREDDALEEEPPA